MNNVSLNDDLSKEPHAGFPPLFVYKQQNKNQIHDYQYQTNMNIVSIDTILKNKTDKMSKIFNIDDESNE
jgi:hypothetical protein